MVETSNAEQFIAGEKVCMLGNYSVDREVMCGFVK